MFLNILLLILFSNIPRLELVPNEGHFSDTRKIAVCADGEIAVTQAEFRDDIPNDPIKIWSLRYGRLLGNIQGIDFALSPDKKFLYVNRSASNSIDSRAVEVWNLTEGKIVQSPQWIHRVTRISSDGRLALSHDFLENDGPARNAFIFDLATGEKINLIDGELLAISDNFKIAVIRRNGNEAVYRLGDNIKLNRFKGDKYWISANGHTAISIEADGAARMWSRNNNQVLKLKGEYNSSLLSDDGNIAVLETIDKKIKIVDTSTDRYFSLTSLNGYILASAINASAHQVAFLVIKDEEAQTELLIYSLKSGELLQRRKIDNYSKGDIEDGAIAIDIDHRVVVGGGLEAFHCWRISNSSNTVSHTYSRLGRSYVAASCLLNEDMILCRQFYDEETYRWAAWSLKKGNLISTSEQDEKISEIARNAERRTRKARYLNVDRTKALSVDTKDRTCRVWDLKSGELIKTIDGAFDANNVEISATRDLSYVSINGVIWNLNESRAMSDLGNGYSTITPDGKIALITTINGIEFWSITEKRLLATAINYDEEWLVYTPEGYFDASPAIWPMIAWRSSKDSLSLLFSEQYFKQRYRAGLLSEILTISY